MRIFLLVTLFFGLLTSCKKYGPADAAFYIKSGPVSVSTKKSTQGSGSHKITDLFLYVDGKFQGAYPVGSLLPIVTNNKPVTINVFAGIKNNGISQTRISWTFYKYIEFDTLVESGKTIERPFTFTYDPYLKFEWLEDFDNPVATTVLNSAVSSGSYQIAPVSESFEGRSLLVQFPSGSGIGVAQVESSGYFPLPTGSSNVFLEINYKCNQIFEVGLFGGSERKAALNVNPSESWNKIYIQLADAVSNAPVYNSYKVYFRMLKTEEGQDPKLYLDNIKLIHFQ
jgi:hypothetical protein